MIQLLGLSDVSTLSVRDIGDAGITRLTIHVFTLVLITAGKLLTGHSIIVIINIVIYVVVVIITVIINIYVKQDNVQRTRSLSHAISNTLQDSYSLFGLKFRCHGNHGRSS